MRWTFILVALFSAFIERGGGICVLDNKYGWHVDCGIRDSYLFRLKDIGGFKANFDFGFGLGNEEGFKESIRNTQGGYHRRNDDGGSEEIDDETSRNYNNAPTAIGRSGDESPAARQRLKRPVGDRAQGGATRYRPIPPSFGLLPPPLRRRQIIGDASDGVSRPLRRRRPQAGSSTPFASAGNGAQTQQILVRPGTSPTIVFTQGPAPTATPTNRPTVGPAMGDLLKLDAGTPADTDHVPSFAAKMFVVREAPQEFHPPGYQEPAVFPRINKRVEVPRTKFFCEEQKYLPGVYADVQLGCKVFHLCLPAAMGNTLTSFICPNMTLFDQSIMQCNYWYHVNCENSPNNYDANLQLALSYRKMNAAQLPLTAVREFDNVALLSHNTQEMKNHQTITPGDPNIAENLAFKRIGEVERLGAARRMGDVDDDDFVVDAPSVREVPRGPRMLDTPVEDKSPKADENEEEEEEVDESAKNRTKRSILLGPFKSLKSPFLYYLQRR